MPILAINTPLGQETLADELKAVEIFEAAYPRTKYMHTDKETDAKVDGVLNTDGKLNGLVMTSCRRNCTLATYEGPWNWEWIQTKIKLLRGGYTARNLRTPLWGFLYIVDEDVLLIRKLYDGWKWVVPIETRPLATQATVNTPGFKVPRTICFVKMDKATVLRRAPPLDGEVP